MKKYVIFTLCLTLVLAFAQLPQPIQAQASAPLAYIDNAGNVNWLSAGTGLAITHDGDFKPGASSTHAYTHLRWSPDGSKLAFQDEIAGNLFVAALGKAPLMVASHIATEYPPAWLPDGSAVAYVVNSQQSAGGNATTMQIQQVPASGGQPSAISNFAAGQGCGGGSTDPAMLLYMQETALNGNFMTLAWTKDGWLYSTACTGVGLALNNATNQQQWRIDNVGRVAVSPSGTQAAAVLINQNGQPSSLIYIDLATGRNGALNTGSAVDQVGWSADETSLIFSTIDGQNVSLWKIPVQGTQPTQLFADQGKYIGVITTTPDSQSVVFSYISADANPQTQILSIPANSGVANRSTANVLAQGGQPTFALTPQQTAAPTPVPTNTPVAAACTPRADWTVTYTVVPGDTVSNLAVRTGTTVSDLAAGNCLANASIIYVGQVLHLPGTPAPQQATVGRRIVFPTGATTVAVTGQVAVNSVDTWVLAAQATQTLTAQLAFTSGSATIVVFGADGTVLQPNTAGVSSFSGVLSKTQDYFIEVVGNTTTATSYTLTINVPPVSSAPPPVARRIVFPAGATTVAVQGQIAATATDRWVLAAQAGQTMTATLTFSSGQAILIVFGADGNVLQSDHATSPAFTGTLPTTQDYIIDVRGNPTSATSYTLTITVPPVASPPQPVARRIVFPAGATIVSVQGQLAASGMDRWVLAAQAGQTMTAQLTFASGSAILIVFGTDGTVLLSDHAGAITFTGELPSTQDYIIDVRGNPTSATSYTLTISIPPR